MFPSHQSHAPRQTTPAEAERMMSAGHAVLLDVRGTAAVDGGMRAWAAAGLPVVSAHGTDGQVI